MHARFLLGPAGTGKTFRCLEEIRTALRETPDGPPLILLAPKQATFQLERQLLAGTGLAGYTRLHILSFERLSKFILDRLQHPPPKLLSEEGRIMVLRALLARHRGELKIFHGSAGMAGFAGRLSLELREMQRQEMSPAALAALAARPDLTESLRRKLRDLSLLQRSYFDWLKERHLLDADSLPDLATEALGRPGATAIPAFAGARLWLDGFGEMAPQELTLLAALGRHCEEMTLAFCVDVERTDATDSWLSIWAGIGRAAQDCRKKLGTLPEAALETVVLRRNGPAGRFAANPVLAHLEEYWEQPKPFSGPVAELQKTLRTAVCSTAEEEAVLAAREIRRLIREGGRFREAAVLLRTMEGYDEILRRVFSRYEIPFFLDRRESSAHHPLAELTRNALRLVVFDWQHEDWFGALKTGLVTKDEQAVDRLENEALARGWKGTSWTTPFPNKDGKMDEAERLRQQWTGPFLRFRQNLLTAGKLRPTGAQLAAALRELWRELKVEDMLAGEQQVSGNPLGKQGSQREEADFSKPGSQPRVSHPAVDLTVWRQMEAFLANLELAFAQEAQAPGEWLTILEAGLAGLTTGVVPPALDQVLVGTVDRSRNPELKLALVLGVNESVFPARPASRNLLTGADTEELEECGLRLGPGLRQVLGRERFFGYIACTRSREKLILTCAQQDAEDQALNPSPFFSHLQRLFPQLELENFAGVEAAEPEHVCELIPALVRAAGLHPVSPAADHSTAIPQRLLHDRPTPRSSLLAHPSLDDLLAMPAFAGARQRLRFLAGRNDAETLSPGLAARLYGPDLSTSVSRMEQYAACAFRFFVNSGLKAEERQKFELDQRQKGSFQHLALELFHDGLVKENKTWHGLTPDEARKRVAKICAELAGSFEEGLLAADARSRFTARSMARSLEDFVAAMVGWMSQYEFEPAAAEVGFGGADDELPAWTLELGAGRRLLLRGRIDRLDLRPMPGGQEALAVVIDYKSSWHNLDPLLLRHGLQLQLPAYLGLLRTVSWPATTSSFRLVPAGVFYINLRGDFERGETRSEVLQSKAEDWQSAYKHVGRFDLAVLPHLDNRGAAQGTQFNFRLKKDGQPHATSRDAMNPAQFAEMLEQVEQNLVRMGRAIFDGEIAVNPFQKGGKRACDLCEYQGICRIDAWTHSFRQLGPE